MSARFVGVVFAVLALGLVSGCSAEGKVDVAEEEPKKKKKKKKEDDEAPAAASVAPASAAPSEHGPTVTIPAGSFRAGSRCYDLPRITDQELEHEEITMGEIRMDLYPYPNEVGQPAKVDVTWHEAKELCAARGKRLCSELEWERACKGPKSTTYMWGDQFGKNQKDCEGRLDHLTGQRPACKTEFGVMDMVGAVMEWTDSDWERGTPTGDKVVRGAREKVVSWLSARCTHSRKRDPKQGYGDVGFRCCEGPESPAKVVLRPKKEPTLLMDTEIDEKLEAMLMKGMPADHRAVEGVAVSFDEVYRWHPVPGEEMVIGRWRGQPESGGAFHEMAIFKVCAGRAWLAERMRGPVGSIGKIQTEPDARKLRFEVKSDNQSGEVSLKYWHGTVKLEQPKWLAAGNRLDLPEPGRPTVERRRMPVMKKKP